MLIIWEYEKETRKTSLQGNVRGIMLYHLFMERLVGTWRVSKIKSCVNRFSLVYVL